MSRRRRSSQSSEKSNRLWWPMCIILVCFAAGTRFYKVTEPDHVCWDETHFGKMASWYIKGTFFFDVHPPLGKMLIGLAGKLSGYDGSYPFEKPGDKYNGANYEGMRIFCTALGASIIPIIFLSVWEMTHSLACASLAALFLLCDVGFLTLNRYILLDPILLFFMSGSILCTAKVSSLTQKDRLSDKTMIFWQFCLGLMLACTISVKFVGLFIVLYSGFKTIADLWHVLGDLTKPATETLKQLILRAVTLILWPMVLYVFFFWIHLTVLNKSGLGDGFYSSGFQSTLIGNSLHNASAPRFTAYGAVITLKNHRTGGGYLHSHHHLYPAGFGAKQQQITTYTHKDDNNKWIILPYENDTTDGVVIVKHGDLVRLKHMMTGRNLHSHQENAPITQKHLQVTGYGENGNGDANDVWKVQISNGAENDGVKTVTSLLTFVHYLQACVLTTTGKQLPKWGFEQQEVTCNPNMRDVNALWNVEHNEFEELPKVSFEEYAPNFIDRFIESHAVMLQGNSGLKPREGEVTSKPWQWPINYKGQFFSAVVHRVYLLGNPIIWWINLTFLGIFVIVYIINAVREQRNSDNPNKQENNKVMLNSASWLFFGWVLHYLPFWAMGRVLYFHHYFPALVFSSMNTGILTEYILSSLTSYFNPTMGRTLYQILLGLIVSSSIYGFQLFAPLAYGMEGPLSGEPDSSMYGLKWLESWEF